jgi:selenophosphate synthase
MLGTYSYHEIFRKTIVAFGTLFNNIELLPGTVKFLEQGIMPGGSKRNLKHAENFTIFNPNLTYNQKLITCDAQTSGGL